MINLLDQSRQSELHEKEFSVGQLEEEDESEPVVKIKIVYGDPEMRMFRINRDLSKLECTA